MTLHTTGATTPGARTATTSHLRSVGGPTSPTSSAGSATPHATDDFDDRLARIIARRKQFQDRHAQRLTSLMAQRDDLRGVHALADLVDDAIRWTA